MTTPTLAMTKLDAVNQMLHSIGQSPVNTLVGTLPKDVNQAVEALDHVVRELCSSGWSFNSRKEVPLSPSSGKIDMPATAAFIDPSYGENYVPQWDTTGTPGLRLFNLDDNTFDQFGTEDVKVDIVYLFEFEQVPQHARAYMYTKAARKFQAGLIGSKILYEYTADVEQEAYANFRRTEKRQKDYNINRYSAGVHRRRNPSRY